MSYYAIDCKLLRPLQVLLHYREWIDLVLPSYIIFLLFDIPLAPELRDLSQFAGIRLPEFLLRFDACLRQTDRSPREERAVEIEVF